VADIYKLEPNKYLDLTYDEQEATSFLRNLTNTSESQPFKQQVFVFTVFPDNKAITLEQRKDLSRQFIGTWESQKESLIYYNRLGCGVFVTVNKTDGQGRKNHNIVGINTIFVEDDTGEPKNFPIEPSMVIQTSPNKYHYYFLTDTTHKLEARAVQEHMVQQYNSDPNAKDLARVLRIPGFHHLKNTPFKVHRTNTPLQTKRYTWDEILKAFPPAPIAPRCTPDARKDNILQVPDTVSILAALSYIDPEFPNQRDGWLKVIMGLHHEYRGQQEGRQIALDWSKGKYYRDTSGINPYENSPPSTYVDDDDINYIWDSFSFDTNTSNPVTIGTMFAMAMDKGFTYNFEPPPFIIKQIPDTADSILKKISRYYAITRTSGGDVKIVYKNVTNGLYNLMSEQSFKLDIAHLKIPTTKTYKDGTIRFKSEPAATAWIHDNNTFHYKDMVFKPEYGIYSPEDKTSLPKEIPDNKVLNRFSGYDIRPVKGNCDPILDLVQNVICSGKSDLAEHFHKWVAHTRRYPDKKTGLMITLMGEKGTGKSVMSALILALHTPFTYTTSNFKALTGQFNSHFAYTTMIGLEEATWGGREQDNSILKDLITQETLVVNTKFLNVVYDSPSCFDIIATANPGFSVPESLRDEERRFWTLSVSDVHRKDKTYFKQFGRTNTKKRKRLLEAYAYYLDNLDLTDYDPQAIPEHVGKHSRYNQIESGGDPLHFLIALCEDEEIIPTDASDPMSMNLETTSINEMWNNEDDNISTTVLLPVKLFKQAYTQTARFERTATVSAIHIAKEMDRFLPFPHEKRKSPTKIQLEKFTHLKKNNPYLAMPNRKHCIEHLKQLQLWV